jgi:ABC-type transporter Mla subunit MlaD
VAAAEQEFDLASILPADLQDRARSVRDNPSPLTATSPPPGPGPSPHVPAAAAAERPASQPAPQAAEPTPHVLRLANDVRVLTYALSYMQERLTEAIEARNGEAQARGAVEAELAKARGEIQRLTAELAQLRQGATAEHRQAEQFAERAAQAEARLQNGLQAANTHIAALTEQAAALEAAINQLRQTNSQQRADLESARRERDSARQHAASLEAQLSNEGRIVG